MKQRSISGKTFAASEAAPLERIRAKPYSFIGLALTAGVAAGLFLKIRTLRRGLKWYLAARRFV